MSTTQKFLLLFIYSLFISHIFPRLLYSQDEITDYNVLIDDARIGLCQDILVDERYVYVGDLLNYKVHRYNHEGSYDKSFGIKGKGPGQFQSISGLQIGPNDSLYVYDRTQRRLVTFPTGSKTNESGRTTRLSSGPGRLQPNNLGSLIAGIEGMWLTSNSRPLVVYNRPVNPMKELEEERHLELRFGMASSDKSPVLRIRDRDMLTLKTGSGAMLTVMPFGKKPVIEVDQKRDIVYFGYSDSLIVREKPIGQRARTLVSHEYSRVAVSDDLLRSKLKRENDDLIEEFDTIREKVPSHVPAFEDFEIDNSGRIWIAVNTRSALEGGHTEYWIFDPHGNLLNKVSFDHIIFLKSFSNNNTYGILTRPDGSQKIIKAPLSSMIP